MAASPVVADRLRPTAHRLRRPRPNMAHHQLPLEDSEVQAPALPAGLLRLTVHQGLASLQLLLFKVKVVMHQPYLLLQAMVHPAGHQHPDPHLAMAPHLFPPTSPNQVSQLHRSLSKATVHPLVQHHHLRLRLTEPPQPDLLSLTALLHGHPSHTELRALVQCLPQAMAHQRRVTSDPASDQAASLLRDHLEDPLLSEAQDLVGTRGLLRRPRSSMGLPLVVVQEVRITPAMAATLTRRERALFNFVICLPL